MSSSRPRDLPEEMPWTWRDDIYLWGRNLSRRAITRPDLTSISFDRPLTWRELLLMIPVLEIPAYARMKLRGEHIPSSILIVETQYTKEDLEWGWKKARELGLPQS